MLRVIHKIVPTSLIVAHNNSKARTHSARTTVASRAMVAIVGGGAIAGVITAMVAIAIATGIAIPTAIRTMAGNKVGIHRIAITTHAVISVRTRGPISSSAVIKAIANLCPSVLSARQNQPRASLSFHRKAMASFASGIADSRKRLTMHLCHLSKFGNTDFAKA